MGGNPQKGLVHMATATIRKWGNSLAIRIPNEVISQAKLDEGVEMELLINEANEVLMRPAYPDADDQVALRQHFLKLRSQCKPALDPHQVVFEMPTGDEQI